MNTDLGTILDLTWKLLLVLGLAVLAMRGLRWLSNPNPGAASAMQVLGRVGLGSQQSLVLLGVGSKRLVLGVTPQQITLLTELSPADLPEAALDRPPSAPPWANGFRVPWAPGKPEQANQDAVSFAELLRRVRRRPSFLGENVPPTEVEADAVGRSSNVED